MKRFLGALIGSVLGMGVAFGVFFGLLHMGEVIRERRAQEALEEAAAAQGASVADGSAQAADTGQAGGAQGQTGGAQGQATAGDGTGVSAQSAGQGVGADGTGQPVQVSPNHVEFVTWGDPSSGGSARQETAAGVPLSEGATLTVHYLDVGQGDCIYVTDGTHHMLIDAGTWDKGTMIRGYLQNLGVSHLDIFIMTHPHADHIGGAASVIYHLCDETTQLFLPDVPPENSTSAYENLTSTLFNQNLRTRTPSPGDTFSFGEAVCTVLGPRDLSYENINDVSIVLRMTFGARSFLFMGDAEADEEADLLRAGDTLQSDVLKVGHHGSSTSSTENFIRAVQPSFAVISCGVDNEYYHPHRRTLDTLRDAGCQIFRTDEQGTVICTTDGETLSWNLAPSGT